uniref:Enoyl reductase (ER) domain-containing protein n=1 Tax=Bionectria ochroleuca TaxID=29856 RepID=A0A8H7K4D2_BIOOC
MPHNASTPQSFTEAIVSHPPVDGERQWKLEEIKIGKPAAYEAVVEIVASGICHTDLGCGTAPDGTPGFPVPPYPRVLGHEGAGIVREVGSRVSKVKAGDKVLLSFAFCTQCHNCQFGAPGYCSQFSPINFTGNKEAFTTIKEGKPIGGSFFGQSSFSRLTKVQEVSMVKVNNLITGDEEFKLFAPLGCGIQTGAGTVTQLAKATADDTIAVIGLGGVGLSAIMAAKLQGCKTIIGIDRVPERIELAKSLEEVRKLTKEVGTTITIDATGVVPLIQQGVEFTANQGQVILLGVAPMDAGLQVQVVPFMVYGGGVYPEEYIPQMIRWYQSGRFPVDRLVKFYKVEDYQQAIRDMEDGSTIKPVLLW